MANYRSTTRRGSRRGSRRVAHVLAFVGSFLVPTIVATLPASSLPGGGLDVSDSARVDPERVWPVGSLSETYPSDDCASGVALIDGHVERAFVRLRTASVGGQSLVCMAVDGGGSGHVGAKLVVGSPSGAPVVDDDQAACSAPANVAYRVFDRQLSVGPNNEPVRIEVNVLPGAAWVCLKATNTPGLAKRVVVVLTPSSGVVVLPDSNVSRSYTEQQPTNTALPSSVCQLGTTGSKQRVLNLEGPERHVWLYARQETAWRTSVCVRVEGDTPAGGRLTIDGDGSQTFVITSSDLSPCTFNVVTDSGPPPSSIRLSPPGNVPASVCVAINGIPVRVTVSNGTQAVLSWTPDT